MKKIISVLFALILAALPLSICASAVVLSDGTYEVPVVLMHKEDEKESFGNKYVAQTAMLEVTGDKKTITILLTTDMKGIEFSYYTNGSLEGSVTKGRSVSNITVAGKIYKQGFEIPVMSDGDIGLQFSVPVMPMSPSARLRVDYGEAVLISSTETTVIPEDETATQIPTTELLMQALETTSNAETTEVTTPTVIQPTTVQEKTTMYINEIHDDEINEEKKETISSIFLALFSSVIIAYIIPILIAVILFIISVIVIKRIAKSKK